eukprot:952-Pleurochrysis_carterae.AAC.2
MACRGGWAGCWRRSSTIYDEEKMRMPGGLKWPRWGGQVSCVQQIGSECVRSRQPWSLPVHGNRQAYQLPAIVESALLHDFHEGEQLVCELVGARML